MSRLVLSSRLKRQPISRARVLVVDDDPEIRNLLAEYLSTHGYEVALADCGEAMRAQVERDPPAVVLLDLGLPDEDGLTLARYTGADDVVDRVVGLEVGVDDGASFTRAALVPRRGSRAFDAGGTAQPLHGARNAVHTVPVSVR